MTYGKKGQAASFTGDGQEIRVVFDKSRCMWVFACDHPVNDAPPPAKPPKVSLRWLLPPLDEDKARKYLQVAEACAQAGVAVPVEVLTFFGVERSVDITVAAAGAAGIPVSTWHRTEPTPGVLVATINELVLGYRPKGSRGLEIVVEYKE
jgi:DNA-binding transcriptional LysR family regulator